MSDDNDFFVLVESFSARGLYFFYKNLVFRYSHIFQADNSLDKQTPTAMIADVF